MYKQWDIEWLLGSLTLNTNGFSSGDVYVRDQMKQLKYSCVCVTTEAKYFHSFDNIYI